MSSGAFCFPRNLTELRLNADKEFSSAMLYNCNAQGRDEGRYVWREKSLHFLHKKPVRAHSMPSFLSYNSSLFLLAITQKEDSTKLSNSTEGRNLVYYTVSFTPILPG